MKYLSLAVFLIGLISCDQNSYDPTTTPSALYFPPVGSNVWETQTPASLGWNEAKIAELDAFMESTSTRAILVLKDGKMVIEKYQGKQLVNLNQNFTAGSTWYWASAGKTLTAVLAGIAESQNKLDLDFKTSAYLGNGWTSLALEQENKITVRHQLTMTTGLDDSAADKDCTDPSCLVFKAEPGTRWAYHNAPYTLLDGVLTTATGKTLNNFLNDELKTKTGMDGQFIKTGDNNVFYSTPRSMARFGLLLLNNGRWEQTQLVPEAYVKIMINTSQNLNLSYGYLTWLNGKASHLLPGLQIPIPGSITPNAPAEMYAAMGKNGQLINVVPSQKLIVIRVGDAPDTSLIPYMLQNDLWAKLNEIIP